MCFHAAHAMPYQGINSHYGQSSYMPSGINHHPSGVDNHPLYGNSMGRALDAYDASTGGSASRLFNALGCGPSYIGSNHPVNPGIGNPIHGDFHMQGAGRQNDIQGNFGPQATFSAAPNSAGIFNNIGGAVNANLQGPFTGSVTGVGNVTVNGTGGGPVVMTAHSFDKRGGIPTVDINLPPGAHQIIATAGSGSINAPGARVAVYPTRGGQEFHIFGAEQAIIGTGNFTSSATGREVNNTGIQQIAENTWVDGGGNRYIFHGTIPPVSEHREQPGVSPADTGVNSFEIFGGPAINGSGFVQDGRPGHPTWLYQNGMLVHHAPMVNDTPQTTTGFFT